MTPFPYANSRVGAIPMSDLEEGELPLPLPSPQGQQEQVSQRHPIVQASALHSPSQPASKRVAVAGSSGESRRKRPRRASSGNLGASEEASESDDEPAMRPSFAVSGRPDFASGPPADAFEYLRRVRWEAAQAPEAVVARGLDRSSFSISQTVFAPILAEPEAFPAEFAPSGQWLTAFLSRFADLRQAMFRVRAARRAATLKLNGDLRLPPRRNRDAWRRFCLGDEAASDPGRLPLLPLLLRLDNATTCALVEDLVEVAEAEDRLPRQLSLWLFALLLQLQKPLHADTAARLRLLARLCARLRSRVASRDDPQLAALNVMIAIAAFAFQDQDDA